MTPSKTPDELVALYASALAPFVAEAQRITPADAEIFDAHTHLGLDEDGRSLDLPTLLAQLDAAGAQRACVFPLNDPERVPRYSVPNDRVLRWAEESDGRLIPFCRLDPEEEPLAEAERCLQAGARGIKLHPRAQAFGFESAAMNGIFQIAEDASVPILIHAGRGMPPIADALADLALKHPGATLILAHSAICDQGILTTRLADHPAVLYDTSCFFPVDLIELFARVPSERIVFASDPPYGLPATGLYMVLRVAAQFGLEERALRGVLGGTIAGLFDGSGLPAVNPPRRGETICLSGRLARVYGYAGLAGPAMFAGAQEQALAMLELALAACRDPDPGEDGTSMEMIGTALQAAVTLLREGGDAPQSVRGAIDLLFRSTIHAATAFAHDGFAPEQPLGDLADAV
ncbi:MAG TPA: amidohydrolase family protein [Solirubrobacteraceae bacterium]|jgi:predicted TIM-barrel fold metal-dependent hydrolase